MLGGFGRRPPALVGVRFVLGGTGHLLCNRSSRSAYRMSWALAYSAAARRRPFSAAARATSFAWLVRGGLRRDREVEVGVLALPGQPVTQCAAPDQSEVGVRWRAVDLRQRIDFREPADRLRAVELVAGLLAATRACGRRALRPLREALRAACASWCTCAPRCAPRPGPRGPTPWRPGTSGRPALSRMPVRVSALRPVGLPDLAALLCPRPGTEFMVLRLAANQSARTTSRGCVRGEPELDRPRRPPRVLALEAPWSQPVIHRPLCASRLTGHAQNPAGPDVPPRRPRVLMSVAAPHRPSRPPQCGDT